MSWLVLGLVANKTGSLTKHLRRAINCHFSTRFTESSHIFHYCSCFRNGFFAMIASPLG